LESDWLAAAANSRSCRDQILEQVQTSSGLHTINSTVVGGLLVAVPPIEEQRAIVEVISSMAVRLRTDLLTKSALVSLKSALMSVLLTGEVRVTPDEPAA
jgi:type I restriction enzyme S subunit